MMCCCWPIGSAVLTAGLQEARQGGVTPPEQTIGRTGSVKSPQDGAIKPEVCLHARLENKTLCSFILLHKSDTKKYISNTNSKKSDARLT